LLYFVQVSFGLQVKKLQPTWRIVMRTYWLQFFIELRNFKPNKNKRQAIPASLAVIKNKSMLNLCCLFFSLLISPDDSLFHKSDEFVKSNLLLPTPYIIADSDSIVFIAQDSILSVQDVWSVDTDFIWLQYKDHGNYNFWAKYRRSKYGSWDHDETLAKSYIKEYFEDKNITSKEIIIFSPYSLVLKTRNIAYAKCGGCYRGIDYLFKISRKDIVKIEDVLKNQFTLIKVNYR
jgi:hypothetical protein